MDLSVQQASVLSALLFFLCSVANLVIVLSYLQSPCFNVFMNTQTPEWTELSQLPLMLDPVNVAMVLQPSDPVHVCLCVWMPHTHTHTLTFNSFPSAACKHSGISAWRAGQTIDVLTLAVTAGGSISVFVCTHCKHVCTETNTKMES